MHGADWLTDFDQRIQDLGARARQAQDALTGLTGTAIGGSGAVTVTVNATGALQRISFGDRADELSRPRLAELILDAARRAHADVARSSAEALRPVVGGTAAERFLAQHLPPDPSSAEPDPAPSSVGGGSVGGGSVGGGSVGGGSVGGGSVGGCSVGSAGGPASVAAPAGGSSAAGEAVTEPAR